MDPTALAAEVAALREQLAERERELAEHKREIAERALALALHEEEIAALTESNEQLARMLAMFKNRAWGKKSERFDATEQAALPLALIERIPDEPLAPKTIPTAKEGVAPESPEKAAPTRARRLANSLDLPKRKVTQKVPAKQPCAKCGGPLRVIGESTTRRVEWIPGRFEIIEAACEKAVCPACPGAGVVVALGPEFALPRAECGNGLLARTLVDKFADHIPLNRQAKRMEREGVPFESATLSGWVLAGAALLAVIVEAMHTRLMTSNWLQVDGTGYPVQDGLDGKLRRGRLWTYGDGMECVIRFTDTKHGQEIAKYLSGFQGRLLVADIGSEFNLVARENDLVRAGCWSHLRRRFFEARTYHPRECTLALGVIRDLFSIEASIRDADLDTRRAVRDRDARPLVTDFGRWLNELSRIVRPKSALGEAVSYALRSWDKFVVFVDEPEIPMHNNRAELQLRQPVVGRKNHLFAGSEGGAQAAATMYSLTVSCMLQGIDPWAYLSDVLTRLPGHPANRVHELTPLAWRLARGL